MAWTPRPHETLTPVTVPDPAALRTAQQTRDREKRERLVRARDRLHADVRHRPEDSSPSIRKMLGYSDNPRPPIRWERQADWTGRLVDVPVAPPPGAKAWAG